MFTGIIEGLGTIVSIQSSGGKGRHLTIDADFELERTKIGDSIAVNGACLTAVKLSGKRFEVDVAPETLSMTTFGEARVGDRVNLERALRLSDRLDGHLVSGHIDGIGVIRQRKKVANAILFTIDVPDRLSDYMIHKGSVAVDGISLTINQCRQGSFELSIIPHTASLTTIDFKDTGNRVNIETDMIGKYVERLLTRSQQPDNETASASSTVIDRQFLAQAGFLKY